MQSNDHRTSKDNRLLLAIALKSIRSSFLLASLFTFVVFFDTEDLLLPNFSVLLYCSQGEPFVRKGLNFFLFSRSHSTKVVDTFV